MRKSFNRRVLLRGLGGAVVAAPFLSSVAERAAKTQGLPPPPAPKRLIVMYTYHGCLTNRWFPAKSHGPLSKADYMAMPTLAPMAPYADKLLMVRGIRAMNEWSFEGTLGQKNDPHTNANGSMFTCHPLTPNATESSASNPGKFDAKPTGRSLDHVCAEQVNPSGGPPLFIQIGGIQGSATNNMFVISYDQPGQIFPGVGTPMNIFTQPHEPVRRGPDLAGHVRRGPPPGRHRLRARGPEQPASGQHEQLGQKEARRLGRPSSADGQHDRARAMQRRHREQAGADGGIRARRPTGDLSKVAPVMMDLAVLSAICDTNRVIFMKMPASANFKFLGITGDATSLSQRTGNAIMGGACVANVIEMIHTIDKWYAQQFAYLVGRLDSVMEGDRKLLDNTATVWFNEHSDGNAHNLNNLPILQAGSCGDYFKVGQAVNVEGGKTDMTPGNSDKDCVDGQTPFAPAGLLGNPARRRHAADQQVLLQPDERDRRQGGRGRLPGQGRHASPSPGSASTTTPRCSAPDAPAVIKSPGEYTDLRAS